MDIFSDEIENDSATTSALFATQQAGDLSQAQASQSQAGEDDLSDTQPQFRPTGIKYFDEKIATNTTTPYDVYLARKFLNIDITMNANVNLNARHKVNSVNSLYNDIRETISGLRNTDEAITQAGEQAGGIIFKHDNAGFFGGVNRKLNNLTGGIYGLSDNAASFAARQEAVTKSIARAETRGKTTNMAMQDARDTYGANFRTEKEYISRMGEGLQTQLIYLKEQARDLEARGEAIPQYLIDTIQEYEGKISLIKGGKYNKQDYKKMGSIAQQWRDSQK